MLIFSFLRIVTRKSSRRSKKNLACTRGSGSLHLDGTREWTESVSAKIKSRTRWEGSAAGRLPYKLKLLFSTESFRDRLRKTFLLEILFGRKSFSRRRVSTTKAFHAFHTSSFRLRALSLKMGHAVWSRVILFNPDEFLFLLNRIYFANAKSNRSFRVDLVGPSRTMLSLLAVQDYTCAYIDTFEHLEVDNSINIVGSVTAPRATRLENFTVQLLSTYTRRATVPRV